MERQKSKSEHGVVLHTSLLRHNTISFALAAFSRKTAKMSCAFSLHTYLKQEVA